MAEQQQSKALSAAFPAPPPFYKHFTQDNRSKLEELRGQQAGDDSEKAQPLDPEKLPQELRYLIPPNPPSTGTYHSFGDVYSVVDVLPQLKDQGIEQLYPSPPDPSSVVGNGEQPEWTLDRAYYLQKMAKSLLLNFMELVGILSVDPSQYGKKIEDLRTLFINAHHLLNEYRPHQARESLILMMEERLEQCRAETAGIQRMKEEVNGVLQSIAQDIEQSLEADGFVEMMDARQKQNKIELEEQRRTWEVLEMVMADGQR